jgi:hypothetical protein
MGFITPSPPPLPIEEWRTRSYLDRIKPLAQDWGINGFGTPTGVFLLYAIKLVIFVLAALLVVEATTPGLTGPFSHWWTEPIVFQKVVVWTMVWELIGLGAGSMPLTFRFLPPIGGLLYWLRPGTVRLPPWPDRVPLTRGHTRTIVDVALYAAAIGCGVALLLERSPRLHPALIAITLGLLALLGLRDKVSYLAARPEVYGILLVVFLFPLHNMIVAAQIAFVCIWLGAAASKLNHHFPFVITVMISNTPWNRSRAFKRRLFKDHPEDMRPGPLAANLAHAGTLVEIVLPLILLFSRGGTLLTIAVVGMVLFHVHITSTAPLAVPLEWNLFMIFGLLFLFGHYGSVPFSTLNDPLLIALVLANGVLMPVVGNFAPDKISFLPAMRYYAGNWATSWWLFNQAARAEDVVDERMVKPAAAVAKQLSVFYGEEMAELLLTKGLAFRAMHSHGRALLGLVPRAVSDPEAYRIREGELVSGVVTGWNFGDGHFHDERLLAAVQERCQFADGELRVITLEAQPAHSPRQRYRIFDAARGMLEEGYVLVEDMIARQPWLDESGTIPVEVIGTARPASVIPTGLSAPSAR